MRPVLIACGGGLVVLLGCVQFASMALYGDLAQPPAVPALLSPAAGSALARPLRWQHAPPLLRVAYARALLHRGETAAAAAIVAQLPAGPDVAELQGQLAEWRADADGAIEWYARARDFERAQRLIDQYDAAAQFALAGQLEARLVDGLGANADAGVRARALWRLGQITQERSVVDRTAPQALERRALDCYDRALLLAPNEETYLLAAGQQALTIGDKAAAVRYYQRALDAVPNSADARAGLDRARS